jgi:hypothetical protein
VEESSEIWWRSREEHGYLARLSFRSFDGLGSLELGIRIRRLVEIRSVGGYGQGLYIYNERKNWQERRDRTYTVLLFYVIVKWGLCCVNLHILIQFTLVEGASDLNG